MTILIFDKSKELPSHHKYCDDAINVIYQFFIPESTERLKEIQTALIKNVKNKAINKIYLLNERIYTDSELGISSDKIVQYNIKSRLSFAIVYKFVNEHNIKGFNCAINSDIYFDSTVSKLRTSGINETKTAVTLLRHNVLEAKNRDVLKKENCKSKLFGPTCLSQDCWIVHSNNKFLGKDLKLFSFWFGIPGCDNKMVYLYKILGYDVINDPDTVKTYHLHRDPTRNYAHKKMAAPYAFLFPCGMDPRKEAVYHNKNFNTIGLLCNNFNDFKFDDNKVLYEYVGKKISSNESFVIPRIAGIENNYAVIGQKIKKEKLNDNEVSYISATSKVMKNNAGITLEKGAESIIDYSDKYLSCFTKCELYAGWEPWGAVYGGINGSHNFMRDAFPEKKIIWAFAFDIFHYIRSNPWTLALKGKRLLIISPFIESMKEKLAYREKIYGIDLFPDCEFVFIKPPQTQGDEPSQDFSVELQKFTDKLDTISDTYDIALCSAGGYGNLICDYIYSQGKSAIYVGGVLQMYFGIYGTRWLRERPEVIKLYMNHYWSRPTEKEKPSNSVNIEGNCYW